MERTARKQGVVSQQVCRHFNTSRGCFRGDGCRFLHITQDNGGGANIKPSSSRLSDTPCRFFAAGNCNRGDSCWFKHVAPTREPAADSSSSAGAGPSSSATSEKSEEESHPCVICFEESPISFGLLTGCSHPFCLDCIRSWRDTSNKEQSMVASGVIKQCPACRAPSSFITPSSKFYPDGHPMKARTIATYKSNLSRIPCKYFARPGPTRHCPFGKDCFYQHQNADGTPYVFEHGVEEMQAEQQRRNARRARAADFRRYQEAVSFLAGDLLDANFEAFMASLGEYGGIDDEDDEDEEEYEEEVDEEEEEDEEEVDEEDDLDLWDDVDTLQRALEEHWIAERVERFLFRRPGTQRAPSWTDSHESSEEQDDELPPPLEPIDNPVDSPGFVPASSLHQQNSRRRS